MKSTKLRSWTRSALGLYAAPVPPDVFAISSNSLSYARIVRHLNDFEFDEFRQVDIEAGAFGDGPLGGPLRNQVALREHLEKLLEDLPLPLESASLVLPDSWLRVMFLETEKISGGPKEREQVLRWKLGKVVPFRTEELRVDALEVTPIPGQSLPKRVLMGFASESLVGQIEKAFSDQGIHLGQISNSSLSMLRALGGLLGGLSLGLLIHVTNGSYSLLGCRNGEPIIHRLKSLGEMTDRDAGKMIVQDLMLSRNYLREHLQDGLVGRVLLIASEEVETEWKKRLEEVFELPPLAVDREHLPMIGNYSAISVGLAAALLGAAAGEVA